MTPCFTPAYLEDGVKAAHHILEHLLLLHCESRDNGLHLATVKVGYTEQVAEEDVGVDET